MSKNYDNVERIESQSPNNPYLITNYFLNEEIIQRTSVDTEEDRTEYFKNGKLHKENGPAVVIKDASGFQFEYHEDGKIHRKDGPAIIYASFPNLNKWYIEGKQLSGTEIILQKMINLRDSLFDKSSKEKSTSLIKKD